MNNELPTPPQIAECPELAILAVVDHALEVCVRSLVAAHPELDGPDQPYVVSSTGQYAIGLLRRIWRLKHNLSCYRQRTLEDCSDRDSKNVDSSW